jgi:hypothetical protein
MLLLGRGSSPADIGPSVVKLETKRTRRRGLRRLVRVRFDYYQEVPVMAAGQSSSFAALAVFE